MSQNNIYTKKIEVIWADMDLNQHMRHTSYSQYAAHARICFFADHGFPLSDLARQGLGAVLLREQSTYFREVGLHEHLTFTVELLKSTEDYSRYTIIQQVLKENQKLAAQVVIDGSWIDMKARKIIPPFPEVVEGVINHLPYHKDFEWVDVSYYRFY